MLEMHLHQESKKGNEGYFIEELSNVQFTTYANVTTLAGVTQGNAHNEGQGWLRFDYEGTDLIVSKKTIRHSISWDHLNSVGCVFGTKVITINGNQYKVRLLTGADANPTPLNSGYFPEGTHNSEWSRLFYPLVTDDSTLNSQYSGPKDPRYTNLQLGMITENGRFSWCQETPSAFPTNRVLRGSAGVSYFHRNTSSNNTALYGWRPVLELVS